MIKTSGKDQYYVAETRPSITVFLHDWKRLKSDIDHLYTPSTWLGILASVAYGISGSAFVALWPFIPCFSIEIDNTKLFVIILTICIASLIIGIICSVISHKEHKKTSTNKSDVLDWIRKLEEIVGCEESDKSDESIKQNE